MKQSDLKLRWDLLRGLQMFADDNEEQLNSDENENDNQEEGKESENKEPKTFTNEEVDAIVQKRLARERAKLKTETDKAIKNAQEEAAKLAKMNEEQKRQYEEEKKDALIKAQKAEIDQLKKEALKAELGKQVTVELREAGIEVSPEVLEFVVGDDAEATKTLKDKFVAIIQADRKAQEVKRNTGTTPKRYGGQGDGLSEIEKRIRKYK